MKLSAMKDPDLAMFEQVYLMHPLSRFRLDQIPFSLHIPSNSIFCLSSTRFIERKWKAC